MYSYSYSVHVIPTEYAFPEHDRESCQALAAAESFRADGWNTKIPGTSKEGCDAQNP